MTAKGDDRYYKANREKVLLQVRRSTLMKKYGITLEDYDRMMKIQGGLCAICNKTNPNGFRLAVDHDHETGQVRGLLCQECNGKLGWFETNIDEVIAYLDLHY